MRRNQLFQVSVNRRGTLEAAAREVAYLAEADCMGNGVVRKIPESADSPLLAEAWDGACREADLLLSRYRMPGNTFLAPEEYTAVLSLPPSFDVALSPVVAALLRQFLRASVKWAFLSTAWGADCPPACATEKEECRQRLLEVLNRRRWPLRRPMTFG